MPELTLWKDKEIGKLRRDMDRLFTRMWTGLGIAPFYDRHGMGAPTRISDSEDMLLVQMTLPGIAPGDIDISITRDALTVSCSRKEEIAGERGDRRNLGSNISTFSRTIQLPYRVKISKVKATYKDGNLTIEMPKMKPEKQERIKIELK